MNLRSLIARNLRRNPRMLGFTAAGLVLGVAALVFFVALGTGIRVNVLQRLFVSDQLIVVPTRIEIGAIQTRGSLFSRGSGLDDHTVADLRELAGVAAVYPKQEVAFPAYASGGETLVGRRFWTELIADGIPTELGDTEQRGDVDPHDLFIDWEAESPCEATADCRPGATCTNARCVPQSCTPEDEVWAHDDASRLEAIRREVAARAEVRVGELSVRDGGEDAVGGRHRLTAPRGRGDDVRRALRSFRAEGAEVQPPAFVCPAPSWCQPQLRHCEMPVPALLSHTLLELYNGSVHSALSGSDSSMRALPRMTAAALVGFSFDAVLGRGYLGTSRGVAAGDATPLDARIRIVGFSDLAIAVGATVPIAYVKRWNRHFNGAQAAEQYSSIVIRTSSPEDLHRVAHLITEELGLSLDPRFETSQRASLMVTIVTAAMALLSLLIVGLAALNILHTFLLVVAERRQEIGVMRAVGASRADIRALVLGEAAAIGLLGVAFGCFMAWSAMLLVDHALARYTPDFPFKPETLFSAPASLWLAAIVVGLVCSLAGAWIPASRAASVDPARTMGGY